MVYELTQDENIVKKAIVKEIFIDIQRLENEIADLHKKILEIPFKTKPDQETLDFFNNEHLMLCGKEGLELELQRKESLLIELQNLSEVKELK